MLSGMLSSFRMWLEERPQNSQVKEEGAKETDKGMRTAFR